MIEIIASETRGSADRGWLQAKHTFSFADYQNPERVRFGPLRVINEDRIAPGKGFPTHAHQDMEIITYLISGAIEHKDSMGNGTVIVAGDVQRMTAGTGVQHSEFNPSQEHELHLLQMWIIPEEKNLEPGYEQAAFSREQKLNRLRLVASRDGRNGSVTVHQKVDLYASIMEPGTELVHDVAAGHKVFVQVVYGELTLNGEALKAGDGAKISDENRVIFNAESETELLVFDMG